MSRTARFTFFLSLALFIAILGGIFAFRHYANLPENLSQHETMLIGQSRFVPGSQAAVRLLVRDTSNGAPLPDAEVSLSLQPAQGGEARALYSGKTGPEGMTEINFTVPADLEGEQVLVIESRSKLGSDHLEQPISIERDYRVLLSTDKPLYQPGQVIHVRALALSTFDLTPAAGQPVEIIIADAKGNKVFRQSLTTSEYGAAWTDFQLAGEVNSGDYKISAVMGNTTSEKTVTVEHYVLPKFEVDLSTDRTYYKPGQRVQGTLQADYFYGKPVANSAVVIEGYTFDVQRNDLLSLEVQTDEQGKAVFEFDLPEYMAGSSLEGGLARFYLQASVTDQAQHTETSNLSLPVAQNTLIIEAIPEAGSLRQGVENILYVMLSYPDGSPAEGTLTLSSLYYGGTPRIIETGPYGLAEFHFVPSDTYDGFNIQAEDRQGNQTTQEFYFEGEYASQGVLLRPDQPVYQVGQTMNLTILTSESAGNVYLDIIREGQTVSTRSVKVEGKQTLVAVDLTPDLFGTLELNAYKIMPSGEIVRDRRLVVVDRAADLRVDITPDKEIYLPGDSALLNVLVSGQDGAGAQSALGLAVVDESVFALAEQDPGFAKLYFMLEQELLVPKYDLHGFSVPELVDGVVPVEDPQLRDAVDGAAQAALANALRAGGGGAAVLVNSHEVAYQRAIRLQSQFFKTASSVSYVAFLLLAVAFITLVVVGLWREKRFGRSLLTAIGVLSFILLVIQFLPLWGYSFLDKLGSFMEWLSYSAEWVLPVLALLAVAGFLTLVGVAIARKDAGLGGILLLLVGVVAALGMLGFAASRGSAFSSDAVLLAGVIAFFAVALALWVRVAGYAWAKRPLATAAGLPLAFFILFGILPVAGTATVGSARALNAGPQFMMEKGGIILEEAIPAMAPQAVDGAMDLSAEVEKSAGASTAAEPPRLRQYFPETMLWLPDLITNPDGSLSVDVPVADSITTWRITALASSLDGRLGSVDVPMTVFQDFFIDLDLPLSLTVGDEVAIPVGVFNYLSVPQSVRLELEQSDWFELIGEPAQELEIGANEITVAYFRIKAVRFGMQPFQVTAWGSQMSDAIRKQVQVFPDGKQIRFTSADRLEPGKPVRETVLVPAEAIPGTQTLNVKVYPGVFSQVVEGLDSILRMPNGCFEQTSSSTYPNVLVLDYLNSTNQAAPEAQMKAEEYINLGYQRLTTFEVAGGGFSLFGDAPADRMLTAYGLQEFSDMARVHPVDEAFIRRAADWLMAQQAADGSWENDRGLVHENTWSSLGNDRLPVTAYIVWSLVDAGFADEAATQKGLDYVREFQGQAEDPYVVALVANALVASDLAEGNEMSAGTKAVLDKLAGMATQEGSGITWPSGVATFMGSEGQTGSIETTALAAYALLRSGEHADVANAALAYLVGQKDSFGTWHSTQATVLTLKAMLQSVIAGGEKTNAEVTITLNGGQTRTIQVTPENFDVVQQVSFDDVNPNGENVVEIASQGEGNLMYQVSGGYYLPWGDLALYPELVPAEELLTIDVGYDRAELAVNDTVNVNVKISLNQPGGKVESALIDLGLSPGFSVEAEDLQALVTYYNDTPADYAFARVERYELTGRQIILYLTNLSEGQPLEFSFRLRARFPLRVQTPASSAYDYYNPEVQGELPPQTLTVNP